MSHVHQRNNRRLHRLASKVAMTWVDHLAELRIRLIYSAIAFVLVFILSFTLISKLYHYLVSPLTANHLGLIVVGPGEIVTVYISIAGGIAIGLSLPFVLWQIWLFVVPGLTTKERSSTLRLIPFTVVMFIAGICFSWFLVFPTILHFLIQLTEQQGLNMLLRAGSYFSFLTSIVLPFGFVFELPVVIVFLTRIEAITPQTLRKTRRYAYLVIVIFGVLISPPELISHLSVTVPMICLYELSILLSVIVRAKRIRAKRAIP